MIHDTELTVDEKALIQYRQTKVFRELRSVLTSSSFQAVADKYTNRTRGGLLLNHYRGIGKLALLNNGTSLLTYWADVLREIQFPWDYWAHNFSFDAYSLIAARLESYFYTTKTEGFDAVELGLYRGKWLPVPSVAPGFSVVSNEAVEDACGLTGGQHPFDEDPPAPMSITGPREILVQPGQLSRITLRAESSEPYVTWEISGGPAWASIHRDGFDRAFVEVSPPNNAVIGQLQATISAVDTFEAFATIEIAIQVVI